MNTRAATDGASQPRRSRDGNWWLTLTFAVLIVFDLLYLALGFASLPLYYQRVSTLTVEPYYQLEQIAINSEIVLAAANARGMSPPMYAAYWMTFIVTGALIMGGVGTLVLWRVRRHWFGWFTAHVLLFLTQYPLYQPLQVAQLVPTFLIEFGAIFWPLFVLYFFLFPNGRAVPRWARWPVGSVCVMHLLLQLAGPLASLKVVSASLVESALLPGQNLILGNFVFILMCQIYRFVRVAGPVERQQTKWFVYGLAALIGLSILVDFVPKNSVGVAEFGVLNLIFLPISLAIAITRYRLFDIDVIIRRTLIYGTLTAILAVVYVGSIVVLQALLRPLVGTETELATVASTLAIAALFQPLRRRIQSMIDRRFYRRKYDAQKTVQAFSARLREETDLAFLSDDLIAVIQETLQPAHVSLWLRDGGLRSAQQRAEASSSHV